MEKWERWIPAESIPGVLFAKKIIADEFGLSVTFTDEARKNYITFAWNGTIYSYRVTEEGSLLKTLDYLRETHSDKEFQDWCLFKIRNSEYLKWLKEESYDAYDIAKFDHYAFYTEDGLVEVLSPYAPEVIIKNIT